ncbi:hypothetical protein AB0I81_62610 [Nonomuraea sp. NPDC050404]|uniref:hypothetical protein n=1 Tax=Nonomuraea sp. NPDC050404 TaxID=3155783 RepID=UPI0033D905ED
MAGFADRDDRLSSSSGDIGEPDDAAARQVRRLEDVIPGLGARLTVARLDRNPLAVVVTLEVQPASADSAHRSPQRAGPLVEREVFSSSIEQQVVDGVQIGLARLLAEGLAAAALRLGHPAVITRQPD